MKKRKTNLIWVKKQMHSSHIDICKLSFIGLPPRAAAADSSIATRLLITAERRGGCEKDCCSHLRQNQLARFPLFNHAKQIFSSKQSGKIKKKRGGGGMGRKKKQSSQGREEKRNGVM